MKRAVNLDLRIWKRKSSSNSIIVSRNIKKSEISEDIKIIYKKDK